MEKDKGIAEFFIQNKELLTAVGILGTIVAFITTLPSSWITYLLSFSLTTALALTASGIKVFWKKGDSIQLEFLKLFMMLSFGFFILYILLTYRIMSWLFLFIPIMMGLTYLTAIALRQSQKIMSLLNSDKPIQKILSIIVVIIIVILSFIISWPLSLIFNIGLDRLDHTKTEIKLY